MIYGTQDFAQLLKDIIHDGKRHDLYDITVEHAKEMGVHINGEKPIYLLERARPREDEEVRAYRLENYEPTTKSGADKAIKIVSKGFNPTLYSIDFKGESKESEELETYTMEYYPECNSIINFNRDVLLRKMLADPNGLAAVKPSDVPEDDTEKLEPIVVTYGSCAVWYYDKDCYLISMNPEFSRNAFSDTSEKKLSVRFEYYDKTQYADFTATYDASDKSVSIELHVFYKHFTNKIPVWFLGGEPFSLDNGKIIYKSFFCSALPHWNKAVQHESDLMASIIAHTYPQKYEVAEECAYSHTHDGIAYSCRGGTIKYPSANGGYSQMSCPQCFGTGLVSVKGPLQTYQFLKEKLMEGTGLNMPPVGYIDVPIDATKFLDEYTEKCLQKAMWSINMDVEDKVGEIQSGVAKAIDRSAQNDTIFMIISRVFDVHLNNEYFFIDSYKNGVYLQSTGKEKSKNLPEINKPTNFELLTSSELIFNFKVSKDSGIDRNILRSQAIRIIKNENGSTPDTKNYQIAIIDLDPLYGFTLDEIDLGVSKGVIRKVDWSIHDNIKQFIDRAISENKDFLTKQNPEKIEVLEKFGLELIEAEKPRVDEAAIMTFDAQQNAA